MTAFDYIVLTILIASVIVSLVRGLVKEILSLVAWIIAFICANLYAPWMAEHLPEQVPMKLPAGYLVVFLGVLILSGLVNMAIQAMIKASGLSVADRGLGGLFGFARGCLIVLVVVILAGFTTVPQSEMWQDAKLSRLAEAAVRTLKPLLPTRLASYVRY